MKYKVGDKVRVRSDLSIFHGASPMMIDKYAGKVVTISKVSEVNDSYESKEDSNKWLKYMWGDEMFTGLAEETKEVKAVKKKKYPNAMPELRTGMFGLCTDGNKFVVINDTVMYSDETWDDIPTLLNNAFYGVQAIYDTRCKSFGHCKDDNKIWERREPFETSYEDKCKEVADVICKALTRKLNKDNEKE